MCSCTNLICFVVINSPKWAKYKIKNYINLDNAYLRKLSIIGKQWAFQAPNWLL